jgi:hypothetical protein
MSSNPMHRSFTAYLTLENIDAIAERIQLALSRGPFVAVESSTRMEIRPLARLDKDVEAKRYKTSDDTLVASLMISDTDLDWHFGTRATDQEDARKLADSGAIVHQFRLDGDEVFATTKWHSDRTRKIAFIPEVIDVADVLPPLTDERAHRLQEAYHRYARENPTRPAVWAVYDALRYEEI